ncbi:hypothetical protein, partial [Mesorhizobium sp. M7A.T.Ca.TU.009.02.1.1]|uniref:hypothetical protein n=1 Tax=Mesorhizobium sp. M7A.T.Ca.TU.009.02.1.1 TaxID=2496791 RepID=UPI0013E35183
IGLVHLGLLVGRQLVELAHRHPATYCQDSGVAFLTTKAPETLCLPLVGEPIRADAIDLDLGEWCPG